MGSSGLMPAKRISAITGGPATGGTPARARWVTEVPVDSGIGHVVMLESPDAVDDLVDAVSAEAR